MSDPAPTPEGLTFDQANDLLVSIRAFKASSGYQQILRPYLEQRCSRHAQEALNVHRTEGHEAARHRLDELQQISLYLESLETNAAARCHDLDPATKGETELPQE